MAEQKPSTLNHFNDRFKSNMGTVSRQSLVYFTGSLFFVIAGFLFKVYVARHLGAELLGLYELGWVIITISWIAVHFGLPHTAIKYVSIYTSSGEYGKLRTFISHSFAFVLTTSIIASIVLILFRSFIANSIFNDSDLENVLIIFAPLLVAGALSTQFASTLNGFKEVAWRTVITTFIQLPIKIIITVALFYMGWNLYGYVCGDIGALIVSTVLLWIVIRKRLSRYPEERSHKSAVIADVKGYAATMVGIGSLALIYAKINQMMLGVFLETDQVGIFSMVVTTTLYVPILLKSVNSIFAPIIAELHESGDKKLLGKLFQTLTKWITGFTLPLALVLIFFAKPIMAIFGDEFLNGWTVLIIMTVSAFINVSVGSVGYLLLMSGNHKLEMISLALSAIITLILSVTLIPKYGMLGAGISAASGEIATNIIRLIMVVYKLKLHPYNLNSLRMLIPFLLTGILVFVSYNMRESFHFLQSWILILATLVSAYILFIISALLTVLDSYDRVVLNAVKKKFIRIDKYDRQSESD